MRMRRRYLFAERGIFYVSMVLFIQSTLVMSKSNRLSEILRNIRTSTYQIRRIREKINRITLISQINM